MISETNYLNPGQTSQVKGIVLHKTVHLISDASHNPKGPHSDHGLQI